VPKLVAFLDGDRFVAGTAVEALGHIGPDAKDAVPALTKWLASKQDFDRQKAARALGEIGPDAKAAAAELEKLLQDPAVPVRVWATFALARINDDAKTHLPALTAWARAKKSPHEFFGGPQFDVVQALRLLGPAARPALPLFLELLTGDDTLPGARYEAAAALGQFADESEKLIPKLLELLDRKPPERGREPREYAAAALGALGPNARTAIPRLEKLLEDDEPLVVEAARQALGRIEAEK
jgi:HEAT repeat protein